VRKHFRDLALLLALGAVAVPWLCRLAYQRQRQETIEKAKLCRANIEKIYLACQLYQCDSASYPNSVQQLLPLLKSEPLCPFDGSHYRAEAVLITEENIEKFPQGFVEFGPGATGFKVQCSSQLHAQMEPGLAAGCGYSNFYQPMSPLLLQERR
jgi:hypothetical protein